MHRDACFVAIPHRSIEPRDDHARGLYNADSVLGGQEVDDDTKPTQLLPEIEKCPSCAEF